MTAWLCLPPSGGSTRMISMDFIREFSISADSQHIYTLIAYAGDHDGGEPLTLMKTNNEGEIKRALAEIFVIKNRGATSNADVFIDVRNDGVSQKNYF